MFWVVPAIMAAASFMKGVSGAKAQDKVSKAENKAKQQAFINAVSEINMQRTQALRQTNAALFNLDVKKQQQLSQIGLQSAATDTIGASVQDAMATVDVVTDRQEGAVRRELDNVYQSTQNQLETARQNSSRSMQSRSAVGDALSQWGINTAASFGTSYASDKFGGGSSGSSSSSNQSWSSFKQSDILKKLGISQH